MPADTWQAWARQTLHKRAEALQEPSEGEGTHNGSAAGTEALRALSEHLLAKAHAQVDQAAVDEDNLVAEDGIHHRTGGRWPHATPQSRLSKLLGDLTKHLQGKHDQKLHGRRGPAKVTTFKPPGFVTDAARGWFELAGLPSPDTDWHAVRQDHKRQMRVADAYDAMPAWDDDAVASYRAMADETREQFRYLTDDVGITFEAVDDDPYANVGELVRDVSDNRRLRVLSTSATGGHPYFTDEVNDQFRFVHDFFGHVATGRDFDRHGEEAAFLHHSAMYSDAARPAMVSETRGQNASLIKNRAFPEQKVGLLPQEFFKHMLGRHNQKLHGRREHDFMRFARDVLGQEVQWSDKTYYNPSGDTMMSLLGDPDVEEFRYKTSHKHPGMALLWNKRSKKAVLLSQDNQGRSRMRVINRSERLLRRGQFIRGNVLAAKETGERVHRDIDALLPSEMKQRLHDKGRAAAWRAVTRVQQGKVEKALQSLLEDQKRERERQLIAEVVKHLPGQHDQKDHGNRRPVTQSRFLLGRLERQGGYGYQPVFRDTPRKGKAVSLKGYEVETYGVPTRSNIANFIQRYRGKLQSDENLYVGGWFDRKTGRGYLDLHVVVDSREEAERIGRENEQIAYYDLDNDEEVELAGGREKRG